MIVDQSTNAPSMPDGGQRVGVSGKSSRLRPSAATGHGEARAPGKIMVVPPPGVKPFVLRKADISEVEIPDHLNLISVDKPLLEVHDRVLRRLRSLSMIHSRTDVKDHFLTALVAILPLSPEIVSSMLLPKQSPIELRPAKAFAVSLVDAGVPLTPVMTTAGTDTILDCNIADLPSDHTNYDVVPTADPLFDWDPGHLISPLAGDAAEYIDIVKLYLRQIGKAPLLSAQEEVELARRIEVGVLAEERLRVGVDTRKTRGDLRFLMERGRRARERLTVANLRLVVSIAKGHRPEGLDFLDLVQFGNEGLIRAVCKFDFMQGTKFSTYATWWIRQAISRGVADTARIVRVPVHAVEALNKLQSCLRAAEGELGRRPSVGELADRTGQTAVEVRKILAYAPVPLSLDNLIGDDGTTELSAFVGSNDGQIAEIGSRICRRQVLAQLFSHLSDKETEIIRLRFGFIDGDTRTLDDIGRAFGLTRERIRQLESKAMDKLRGHLEEIIEIRRDLF